MTSTPPHCTIVSIGDPLSPKTWSATPYHLSEAISGQDWKVQSVNARLPLWGRVVCALFTRSARGGNRARGTLRRRLTARTVCRKLDSLKQGPVLHMGTKTLPLHRIRPRDRHCLFHDYTWHLAQCNAVDNVERSGRKRRIYERLERDSYSQIAHFFPVGSYVKTDLIRHYDIDPDRITPVGTGMGVVKPYSGEKDYGNGRILFTAKGRFHDKGGPLVVEAFRIARRRNPNLRLTIVGSEKGVEVGFGEGIDAHGFVPLEQLQRFFQEASLFVLPAANEPWGLVYLEAMSCGTPFIGLDRNAVPELSDHGRAGWVLDEASPEKLADLFVAAFAKPEALAHKGRHARDFVADNYSWERTARAITRVFASL